LVYAAFGFEGATDSFAPATGLTQHVLRQNGGNVRSLLVGYSTTDDTPGVTWGTSGNGGAGVGFIINTAPVVAESQVKIRGGVTAGLVDTGLIARYYIDEAGSGTSPTALEDASSNNYDLTEINYSSGNMSFTETNNQRGLDSTSLTGTQRARRSINDTSDALRDALNGSTKATLEIVWRGDDFSVAGGRVFGINNRSGGTGVLMIRGLDSNTLETTFNNTTHDRFDPTIGSRKVIHIVYDSTQGVAVDRIKVYENGSDISESGNTLTQNSTLSIDASSDLIMFNRESSGTFDSSFDGALYYAAIYSHAFSASEVQTNVDILNANDDTPASSQVKIRGGAGDGSVKFR
jgi:hypothetical protein